MKTIQIVQAFAAGASTGDLLSLAGQNSFFGQASKITAYGNGSAAGLVWNASWDNGSSAEVILPQGTAVMVASTPGKVKTNEDFIQQFAVPSGAKLAISVQNPTAGSLSIALQLNIE